MTEILQDLFRSFPEKFTRSSSGDFVGVRLGFRLEVLAGIAHSSEIVFGIRPRIALGAALGYL